MPQFVKLYVKWVDRLNNAVGHFAMYLLFVMMGILLWSIVSKFGTPSLWSLELAQFTLVGYYLLGGPFSMQQDGHVRMDLLYGSWSDRTKAIMDAFTIFFLIFFLLVLLKGAWSSTSYSFQYWERSNSVWRPYMWPIKLVMCTGILLMLLQAIATFFKDLAKIRGEEL